MDENTVEIYQRFSEPQARPKKAARNFACRMDELIFNRMEAYAKMAHQSKTTVVELALTEYMDAHYAAMQDLMDSGVLNGEKQEK